LPHGLGGFVQEGTSGADTDDRPDGVAGLGLDRRRVRKHRGNQGKLSGKTKIGLAGSIMTSPVACKMQKGG
jgi:hypothetical protein